MNAHMGGTLRYTKYGLIARQVKVIGQRKPGRNAPLALPCVYPFFFQKILSVSMWKLISIQLMVQGLVTGHCAWWSSG